MDHLIQTYGILAGLSLASLGFLAGQVWPVLRDKGIPAWWSARRKREDRWIEVIERNTRAIEAMSTIAGHIGTKQDQMLDKTEDIALDVAVLVDRADIARPSRPKPARPAHVGA